jgi:hypothetical protein
MLNINKSSIQDIRKNLINSNIFNKYLLEDIFVSYLKKYNFNTHFEDNSFIYEETGNKVFCANTIEKKNNESYLNYLGNPIRVFYQTLPISEFKKNFFNSFFNLCDKKKIKNILLCLETEEKIYENQLSLHKDVINKVYQESFINLNLSEQEIFKDISKGHKSELKKKSIFSYKVINCKNYTAKLIFKMMDLHKEVAGKKTRSLETWLENEKMILQNKGFLVCALLKDKIISYSFFFHDKLSCIYFSSCTDREYFTYAGITHNSIWYAIKYLKQIGCKYFSLGDVKTLYSKDIISEKEKNIERFKRSFGGLTKTYIIYNQLPKKI